MFKLGIYKHIREAWKKPKERLGEVMRARMILWRKQPSTVRLDRPTRLDKARSVGYRAKQGILIVRQKVKRGGHIRPRPGKRRPKRTGIRKNLDKNYQQISEERANRKYPNCEVLNSYFVADDKQHAWYEVILVDRAHPAIKKDRILSWAARKNHRGRVFRGKTAAGRRSRGLLTHKGKGTEKLRPSKSAVLRRK